MGSMMRHGVVFSVAIAIMFHGACTGDDPIASRDTSRDTVTDARSGDARGDAVLPKDFSIDLGHDATPVTLQRVVVVADDAETTRATMVAYEGTPSAGWTEVFRHPVVLGSAGLAWGRGMHDPGDIPLGAIIKREGDGKSPMGLFALTQSWGYLAPGEVTTKLPYATATDSLICVDDVASTYYNQVIDWKAEGLSAGSLPSHEAMLLGSAVYKYTIFVAHNMPSPTPGAGSCIFLHLWSGPQGSTAGCTAMAEADIVKLLAWLDPAKAPLLAQLTRAEYARVRSAWNLPTLISP